MEKLNYFEESETWELVNLSEQGTVTKWVFKVKCNSAVTVFNVN